MQAYYYTYQPLFLISCENSKMCTLVPVLPASIIMAKNRHVDSSCFSKSGDKHDLISYDSIFLSYKSVKSLNDAELLS